MSQSTIRCSSAISIVKGAYKSTFHGLWSGTGPSYVVAGPLCVDLLCVKMA